MNTFRTIGLLDRNGDPLAPRISNAVLSLLPRLRRQFPSLQDELALTEVAEEAGRRLARREHRDGRIERLHGYAWVTLRTVAASHVRRGDAKLAEHTVEGGHERIASMAAAEGTPEQIEREILLREVLALLPPAERRLIIWKRAGFSSQEIAAFENRSVAAIDTLFCRAKQRMRAGLEHGRGRRSAGSSASAPPTSAASIDGPSATKRTSAVKHLPHDATQRAPGSG